MDDAPELEPQTPDRSQGRVDERGSQPALCRHLRRDECKAEGLLRPWRDGEPDLHDTDFAQATCGTIRLKLLKIGALVRISVRRIKIAMASACPAAQDWGRAAVRLAIAAIARASPACTRNFISRRCLQADDVHSLFRRITSKDGQLNAGTHFA